MGIWKNITPVCIRNWLETLTTTERLNADSVKEGSTNLFLTAAEKTKLANTEPAGIVQMFAGSVAPTGWLFCDGAAINRVTYANLFAAIGTDWGVGDGSTTFNVPDMRGVYPKGAGTTSRTLGKDANGNFYAGTLAAYSTDKMQGHNHRIKQRTSFRGVGAEMGPDNDGGATYDSTVTIPVTDGINGTPRTGLTTEPQNAGFNFIIKT